MPPDAAGSAWADFVLRPADLRMVIRISVAFLLGAVIGYERESIHRPAGLRTHMLVAAGSAAFSVASLEAFQLEGTTRDPGRIAAQIVTGVGFLGAGTIFRTRSTVSGLTTAASIWLVAAVGMLAGAGLYLVAVFTTLGGFATLRWGRPPSRRRRNHVSPGAHATDEEPETIVD